MIICVKCKSEMTQKKMIWYADKYRNGYECPKCLTQVLNCRGTGPTGRSTKREMCSGCRNNFYNGNNPHGVTQCWSFKTAKVILRKEVHVDQRPPWNQKAKKFLSCYHRPRYVYVGKNQTC